MEVANGVEMLEIAATVMGRQSHIYPTLIRDNETVILVDTGFPGQLHLFREAIERSGVPFDQLKLIILTHQDIDHVGCLATIQKELPGVKVLAHEAERPYIDGEKTPHKLARFEANPDSLTEDMQRMYNTLKTGFANSKANIDQTLTDGEELPYLGGIEVIHTPGHTIGHICLYLKRSKILIAGDVLGIEGGELVKPPEFINFDSELSKQSLRKLSGYDIEAVISYHGGLFKENTKLRIAELAALE